MAVNNNKKILGLVYIAAGIAIIVFFLGALLMRIVVGLMALSLVDQGLRMRGLPSLQMIITMIAHRKRFF